MSNPLQSNVDVSSMVLQWPDADEEKRIKMMQHCARAIQLDQENFDLLSELLDFDPHSLAAGSTLLTTIFNSLASIEIEADKNADLDEKMSIILALYEKMGRANTARFALLGLLSALKDDKCLHCFVSLILNDAPQTEQHLMGCFGAFFRHREFNPHALFPKLFEGIGDLNLAGPVLDLANYVFRSEMTDEHPAIAQIPQLKKIFSGLISQLEVLQKNAGAGNEDPKKIARSVNSSTALLVSLCDTFGLCEDESTIPLLQSGMLLSHRRVKSEAAFALARMGDEEGQGHLLKLAEDPASRARVLRYAEELELLDEVDPDFQSDEALAEARLAQWLMQPTQMGIAPSRIEFLDKRLLHWPGYDELVDCFLFRFWYSFGRGEYSNVGISGPLTFAFNGDMADLPVETLYAAFAGWHAQHEEIEEYDARTLSVHYQAELDRLKRALSDNGFRDPSSLIYGKFFGASVLVAKASCEGAEGIAVTDRQEFLWFPHGERQNPLRPEEAYCIYKGKMLLRNFNEEIE